ncbi:MAG: hypothetical protein ACOC1F_04280 [Myxococcota bacterium]
MLFLALLALAIVSGGCDKSSKINLTDTEGRQFQLTCKNVNCVITSAPAAKPSAPQPAGATAKFVLHGASRLFSVCEVWEQGSSHAVHPADCRALTCRNDGDCPPAKNMPKGTCANRLCIEPSAEVTHADAVLLCLAGTGVPSGTTKQVERYALGNACGSPCVVPQVCRQP